MVSLLGVRVQKKERELLGLQQMHGLKVEGPMLILDFMKFT